MTPRNRHRLPLLTALSAAMLFAHAGAQPPSGESAAMPSSEQARTVVEGEGARLEAAFGFDAEKQRLSVRYRIANTSDAPLAVFDRGNAHAVLTKRQTAGAVGAPLLKQDGGDATLSHIALPLPTPAPTVPPTPLAAKLEAGAQLEGAFEFNLSLADATKRVRWCLGVTTFGEGDFGRTGRESDMPVWTATAAAVARQRTLCTPWFDLAAKSFEVD